MSPRNKRYRKTIGVRGRDYGVRFVDDEGVKVAWFVDGKRHVRLIAKQNTAANREQADRELKAGLAPRAPTVLTLAMLLASYRADAPQRRNPKTGQPLRAKTLLDYAEYERAIQRSGLDLSRPAASLRRPDVRAWVMQQREAKLAEGTIARRVDYLKAVYRWAVADVELIDADPLTGFRSPSRKGKNLPYTEEEGRQLFDAVLALPSRAWRFKLLALLESAYGVRSLQPLGLTWSDFDLDRVTPVPIRGGVVQLVGTVSFRQAVAGSKGQPTRTLPLLPFVREAVLDAYAHRRGDVVFWSWRNEQKASPYGSMNHQLKKLERRAGVPRVKGRAFHAFRRTLSNALVKRLGVLQASGWIADTPEVLMRNYVSATERETLEAAEYLIRRFTDDPKPSPNRQSDERANANSLQDNTGAGGFEPPTFHKDRATEPDITGHRKARRKRGAA